MRPLQPLDDLAALTRFPTPTQLHRRVSALPREARVVPQVLPYLHEVHHGRIRGGGGSGHAPLPGDETAAWRGAPAPIAPSPRRRRVPSRASARPDVCTPQVAHDPRCSKSGVYWSWNGGPREGRGESALEQDGQILGGGGAGGGWDSIYENDQSDKVQASSRCPSSSSAPASVPLTSPPPLAPRFRC